MCRGSILHLGQLCSRLLRVSIGWLTAVSWIVAQDVTEELPLFQLEEYDVVHEERGFAPFFTEKLPELSFFDIPELPRGDLIIALEFMDRYRDSPVPGAVKWAGILSFPVIDGYEKEWIKLICLYVYEGRLFGFDASGDADWSRRFAVPIQFEDRADAEVLYRFAESFVEVVYPGGEEEIWIEDGFDEEDGASGDGSYESFYIEPGRISPVLESQRELSARELVKLIYQYSEPNTVPSREVRYGPPDESANDSFSWESFKASLETPDYIAKAAELVSPRWHAVAQVFHEKKILGLFDAEGRHRVLLFNIGTRLYAYDAHAGLWRTNARLEDLTAIKTLHKKLNYPGIKALSRVELLSTSHSLEELE